MALRIHSASASLRTLGRAPAVTKQKLLGDLALAAGVTALTCDLSRVFVILAIGTAVFLIGHTGASWVSTLLLIRHS